MHFERQGAGPPVVLVHGLGASLFSWRDVVEELSTRFTTYAVDLLGFGSSPAPGGFPYTIAAQAQAVADFMNAQGISDPILIGHSMGGGVCLHLADRASRAVPPSSSRIVLVAPVAYPPIHTFPQPNQTPAPDQDAGGMPLSPAHALAQLFLSRAYAPGNRPTAAQINGYAAGLSSAGQLRAFRMHGANLAGTEAPLPSVAGITNKTLIIWGDEDRIVPAADGTRLKDALPNATLKIIDNSGHVPHEEQAAATLAAISGFLP
jgi:pimeloyl-ACP methyl ester carboxylesterase